MVGNLKVTCDENAETKAADITYNYKTGVFTVNGLKVTGQIEGKSRDLGTVDDLLVHAALY